MKIISGSILFSMLLMACGEDNNFNQFFASKEQKESLDTLVYNAEKFYNAGEYENALKEIDKALEIDKNSEDINVLKSYIHLSLANVDVFKVTKNLIDLSAGKSCNDSTTQTETTLAEESSDAAGTMGKLGCIVGLSEDEIRTHLVQPNNEATIASGVLKGESDNPLFSGADVFLPLEASKARGSASSVISNLNQSITTICPFVNSAAKLASGESVDARHAACTASTGNRYLSAKSHLIWVLAHLTEALAFHSVVLYQPKNADTPSLLARGAALGDTSNTDLDTISTYITAVTELSEVIDYILPTDKAVAADSMLTAVFNNLASVEKGLSQISGVPSSMTKSLTAAIKTMTDQKEKLKASLPKDSSGASTQDAGAAALKQQLTKKVATDLKAQIISKKDENKFSDPEDLNKACDAYETIAEEAIEGCKDTSS